MLIKIIGEIIPLVDYVGNVIKEKPPLFGLKNTEIEF